MTAQDPAYFLYHSIGLYPDKGAEMAQALSGFSETWAADNDTQWPVVLEARKTFLDLWRGLIDAPEGTLTTAENVTVALHSVLGGLPAKYLRGRKVLIAADCFPSLHFLLTGMQERLGFTLETVPLRQGSYWVEDEDMISAWDAEVGLALLTFVTSTASHRPDLDALLDHGKRMGSLVGVDLTQGIGILPFSLDQTPADFVISTSLKWLCGTPGAGIIQMHQDLLADVEPDLRGWFSQDNPFSWDLDSFAYAPDARRFEHGTPSVLAAVGSVPALRWHAAQTDLLGQNRRLTHMILDHADGLGLTIATPRKEARRGGSIMLRLPDDTNPGAIVDHLRSQDIFTDARGQILRLSPGAVTDARHVDRLFSALHAVL